MVIAFMGGLEALMLFVNLRDGGIAQAQIYESWLSQTVFWTLMTFAVVKCIVAFKIQSVFKIEFDLQQGHIEHGVQQVHEE
jgi:hypothetical protein